MNKGWRLAAALVFAAALAWGAEKGAKPGGGAGPRVPEKAEKPVEKAAERAGEKSGLVWKTGSEPLQIDSRTMETFGAEGLVVFHGEVAARQGEVTLHADRLDVWIDKQSRAVRMVKARGSVRIRKEEVVATGAEATYEAGTGVAVLTGDPKVWRDRDVVAGEKITLYLAEDRSVVEGAKAVLYQREKPEAPGPKLPAPKPAPGGR